MRKLRFVSLMVAALFMGFSFISCEEDGSILEVEDEEENGEQVDPEITITEGDNTASTTVYVSDLEAGASDVDVTVRFTSTDGTMRRLYMTQNIAGAGDEKFELELEDLDKKGDGSIDLISDYGNEFTFSIPFPVLPDLSEGTVEYQLWTTSGRGDYRDTEKRLVAGPGTIIINYGGENPDAVAVKEYEAKLLAAPLGSGASETFISLVDGQLYRIDQGEEFVAYWDFGYYYGLTGNASLASTADYPSNIIDIETIANTTADELNHTYFAHSDLDFEAVVSASDLDVITQSADETVTNLAVGDVLEFVDNYGNKGLIRVEDIVGTDGTGDYIELDIKVQP